MMAVSGLLDMAPCMANADRSYGSLLLYANEAKDGIEKPATFID